MSHLEMSKAELHTNQRVVDAIKEATDVEVPIEHVQLVLETVIYFKIMQHTEEHMAEVDKFIRNEQ